MAHEELRSKVRSLDMRGEESAKKPLFLSKRMISFERINCYRMAVRGMLWVMNTKKAKYFFNIPSNMGKNEEFRQFQ